MAPLVPVPFTQLHGVAVRVYVPVVAGVVNVKEKGGNDTVFCVTPPIANTTLCVSELACAVMV